MAKEKSNPYDLGAVARILKENDAQIQARINILQQQLKRTSKSNPYDLNSPVILITRQIAALSKKLSHLSR